VSVGWILSMGLVGLLVGDWGKNIEKTKYHLENVR